jgi:hypothetical protein
MLDILRRSEVMAKPAAWDAGNALGDDTHERVIASAALGVISVSGHSLTDYARGGSAVESVWITAQEHGLAVQSVSSALLYAHDDVDFRELSPAFAGGCAICNTISPSWPTPGQESRRCWYSGLVAHRDRR